MDASRELGESEALVDSLGALDDVSLTQVLTVDRIISDSL